MDWQPAYIDMVTYLQTNPEKLNELVLLYIDTWSYDPNFQEYYICPTCQKYFSHDEVVINRRLTCSRDHFLQRTWTINDVSDYIQQELLKPSFYGTLAVDERVGFGAIIGFAWGRLEKLEELMSQLSSSAAKEISHLKTARQTPYFADFGLALQYRGHGIGTALNNIVCNHFRTQYPNLPGTLRTHQNSHAFKIYRKSGYRVIGYDETYGFGRVIMCINRCADLNV